MNSITDSFLHFLHIMKAGECVTPGSLQAMNAVNPLKILEEFFMTPSFTHWNDFFS